MKFVNIKIRRLTLIGFFVTLFIGGIFLAGALTFAQSQQPLDTGIGVVQPALGLANFDIRIVVARIIRAVLALLGIIALVLMLYAGFIWMTAGGNEEKIGEAKKILINASIGLAIVLSSYAIVSFVINKLVEATTQGDNGSNGGGGGGGNPYFPRDAFYVDQLPSGGDVCVRNVHPVVVFNRGVIIDAALQSNIVIEKESDPGAAVSGTWNYGAQSNIIIFSAAGDCGSGPADCFDPSTKYKLIFKDTSQIKAENDSTLVLNCSIKANCKNSVLFTTGEGVDRLPPTVTIDYPDVNTPLQIGQPVNVKLIYNDDNGVQNLTLRANGYFVGSQTLSGCKKSDTVTVTWPTAFLDPGTYTLESTAYDWAGLTGIATSKAVLRPQHCFNGIMDEDETGIDQGGSCGSGTGQKCTQDVDCSSGYCENGLCIDRTRITNVSPISSAPGDFVTITGLFFGNTPGKVYFASTSIPNDSDWVETKLAQCVGAPQFDNWSPRQILVEAPGLANGLKGPIKIITASTSVNGVDRTFTDATNDNFGPKISDFLFTNQAHPGLCAAVPESASPGAAIALVGKNLGPLAGKSQVVFGETRAVVNSFTKGGGLNWMPSRINEVLVPSLDSGEVGVKALNSDGIESNGIRFVVQKGVSEDSPIISGVTPNKGSHGEYVTITGKNFGNTPGTVLFDDQINLAIKGSFDFPAVCGNSYWSDNQIIVKFDLDQGIIGRDYFVRVQTSQGKVSLPDNNYIFTLQAGQPNPGICKIDPVSGPVPMAGGQKVVLSGEYFGAGPTVYFWKMGADPQSITARIPGTNLVLSQKLGADQAASDPPFGIASGPVIISRGEDKKISNPVSFAVNDCTKQDTCSSLGAFRCCSSGVDMGLCKPNNELCTGETKSTAYVWRFSTQNIIAVPRVVERCDSGTDQGTNIPTPAPNAVWDGINTGGDNHAVCRGALATVEFSTTMDAPSVDGTTVLVNKCKNIDGNDCVGGSGVQLDPGSFVLKAAFGGGGGNRQYLTIKPNAGTWDDNSWYQVVLTKDIKTTSGKVALNLAADKPCSNVKNSAYCFVFKTDTQDCKLKAVVVTPYAYWTQVLEAPMKYRLFNTVIGDLTYFGNGLSTQHCIMMDLKGYDWKWESAEKNYADIFGVATNQSAQASALANTVDVGLSGDFVNIKATASINVQSGLVSKTGVSPLIVDLSKPEITGYWPNCLEACTNADVGARFSVQMSDFNMGWTAVRLEQCLNENCFSTVDVQVNETPSILPSDRFYLTVPHDDLKPNSLYKVTISSANIVDRQLWSMAKLNDPQSKGAPYKQEFTWRFKTKKEACKIDRTEIYPADYQAHYLNDRAVYSVQPYSVPDACSTIGQRLDPWSVNWAWQSSDTQVATVASFQTQGKNRYCTNTCVKRGSAIPSGGSDIYPVCGNGAVEAGEDCDGPDKSKSCGLDCRFLGNNDPKTCGDGVVDPSRGEACDIADDKTKIGCSNDCRHLGSSAATASKDVNASICGNGFLGSGEDCDLEIAPDLTKQDSGLGCSEKCLHLGTRLSTKWCFDNDKQGGYGGFTKLEFDKACSQASSQCGDGVTSPDEDAGCDLGKGKHADWCSGTCLENRVDHSKPGFAPKKEGYSDKGQYAGSSLLYSTPSVCGDGLDVNGQSGIGEDPFCETKISQDHVGLVDPWGLAIGVGLGQPLPNSKPPAQQSIISASTNQKTKNGGAIVGKATFTIPCGYKTDAECQAYFKSTDYGVGYDSCCYARPKLVEMIPVKESTKVCPNTYIEARFNGIIDPASVPNNFILAHGVTGSSNASPTPIYRSLININSDPKSKLAGSLSVAVVGKYAYVASHSSQAVEVVDVSDETNPKHVTAIMDGDGGAKLTFPSALTISDSYLYVVSTGDNNNIKGVLQIFDISNPRAPKALGSLEDGQSVDKSDQAKLNGAYAVAISGNTIYVVSNRSDALQAIDVTEKTKPRPIGSVDKGTVATLAGAVGVAVSGNYAYVTASKALTIFDISNPTKLTAVGSVVLSSPYGIAVRGNYAYTGNFGNSSFSIINISNKTKPVIESTLIDGQDKLNLNKALDVFLNGKYAYVTAQGGQGLEIIDVSSSTLPRKAAHIGPDNTKNPQAYFVQPSGIFVDGDFAYVASYGNGGQTGALEIIDVADFNPLNPNSCPVDVTNLIRKLAGVSGFDNLPWYKKVWVKIAVFFRSIFGLTAEAVNPEPSRWCAGDDLGGVQVLRRSLVTSSVWVQLTKPLSFNAPYAVILKEGLRSINGVSIGQNSDPNIKNINWRFQTDSAICEVSAVKIFPPEWLFSSSGASTTMQALASTVNGSFIQSIPGFYAWDYLWGPLDSLFVDVANTTSSIGSTIAKNRNGEVDVWAAARLTDNIFTPTRGIVGTGKSHVTVFLCENPWPPKEAYYKNQGPFVIFPYEDSENNNDAYDISLDSFSNTKIPPSQVVKAENGYFHFSTYYCADSGSTGKFDDLPYLRPVVHITAQDLNYSSKGICQVTGNSCTTDEDCGNQFTTTTYGNKTNYFIGFNDTGVCGGVTTTNPGTRIFTDSKNQAVGCQPGKGACTGNQELTDWGTQNNIAKICLADGVVTPLRCQKYQPLKRWIFTNNTSGNNDVIGIQIFSNPKHLSAQEWYARDKSAGGQGFTGQVTNLKVGDYPAVSDGNNVYVDALNYSTSTQSLFSTIYLFSINADAKPETRQVFERLLNNLKFNNNLANYGYCGYSLDKPLFAQKCGNDFDCPLGQVCSVAIDKMRRNNQRLYDIQTIDRALKGYVDAKSSYPDLKEGTYLSGQTMSVWSSWSVLGNALGTGLPTDPINQLGRAGTCGTSTESWGNFCTGDNPDTDVICPPDVNKNPVSCVLHDSVTGWSTADRRFSFACASTSYAYRYKFSTSTGFELRSHFEDSIPLSKDSFAGFVAGLNLSTTTPYGLGGTAFPSLVCDKDKEITTLNQGTCGDGQVNWGRGETCDPPGYKIIDKNSCINNPKGNYTVKECGANCTWKAPQNIACSSLAKCGNGKIEPGEICDDGKLNNTYNHCNSQCNGLVEAQGKNGSAGFCGDNIVNPQNEVCDVGNKVCVGGANDKQPCQGLQECNAWFALGGGQIDSGKTNILFAACQNAKNPTPDIDYDCQVVDKTFLIAGTASLGLSSCSGSMCQLAFDGVNAKLFGFGNGPVRLSVETRFNQCAPDPKKFKNGVLYGYGNKQDSCNFDCQSFGPYCGDGIVQPEFGEECDGNESCTVGNLSGTRLCNSLCKIDDQVGMWLRFNNDKATTAFEDASVNNNNAACVMAGGDCPTVDQNAHSGFSVHFDGSKESISVSDSPTLMSNTNFSVEAWIKPETYGTRWQRVTEKGGWGVGGGFGLEFNSGQNQDEHRQRFIIWNSDSSAFHGVDSAVDIPLNQWSHIVGTYIFQNGVEEIKIYVNGVLQGTNQTKEAQPFIGLNKEPITIGRSGKGALFFQGNIDEFKMYKRTLSAAEIRNHFENSWVCQVKSQDATIAVAGKCGDGVVDPKTEVCDKGRANGIACTPSYGKSCSYCSADCAHVIDVQPTEYCGDGKIQLSEVCDTDMNEGTIYARNQDATSTYNNKVNGGYKVRVCADELQPVFINKLGQKITQTFSKGTKYCANNCSKIMVKETGTNSCVSCGVDPNGVSINGNILNVLEPQSKDPLYLTLEKFYLDIISPNIPISIFHIENHAVTNKSTFINLDYETPTKLSSNSLCSTGLPRYQGFFQYDPNPNHRFDFPVVQNSQPWQYDLILSPIMSVAGLKDSKVDPIPQSATPNNIRIVVTWLDNKETDFIAGLVGFDVNQVPFTNEGPGLVPAQGTNYYSQTPSKKFSAIWYHGFGQTAGGINEEAFTVDTTKMPSSFYSFYVRTPGPNFPLKKYKTTAKLKVDVYLPDDGGVVPYNYFMPPYKTFTLDLADFSTQNSTANYWQVFNLDNYLNGLGEAKPLANRLTPVNAIVTAPAFFKH